MTVPAQPKIYHIVHVDRLLSIIKDGYLWCDTKIAQSKPSGTSIGMNHIKQRRLNQPLTSYPDLYVGGCVPFYFCPRSVMLYLIHRNNNDQLLYRGGQEPIVHLEADLHDSVKWALQNQKRWVFTLSNAGAMYFEDRCNLAQLHEIDWVAVHIDSWGDKNVNHKEGKQAEFLMEYSFPWGLVERIGVQSEAVLKKVTHILPAGDKQPMVEIRSAWYY